MAEPENQAEREISIQQKPCIRKRSEQMIRSRIMPYMLPYRPLKILGLTLAKEMLSVLE